MSITTEALEDHDINLARSASNRCLVCQKQLQSVGTDSWKDHVRSSRHKWNLNLAEGRQAVSMFLAKKDVASQERLLNGHRRVQIENYSQMDLVQHIQVRLLSGQVVFETDVCNLFRTFELVQMVARYLMVAPEVLTFAHGDHLGYLTGRDVYLGRADVSLPRVQTLLRQNHGCQLCCMHSDSIKRCYECQSRVCHFCVSTYELYQQQEDTPISCWGCAGGQGQISVWARARTVVLMPATLLGSR